MEMPRKAWIGLGALAFVGVTVAMLPPTKPIGGETVQASRASTPMAPAAPSMAPIHSDRPVTPPPVAVAVRASDQDEAPPTAERSADRPPEAEPRYAEADEDRDEDDPMPASPDIEAAFRAGYQWADRTGTDDRRDCRRWRGSPAEDGCRAKVRERERNGQGEDDPTLR